MIHYYNISNGQIYLPMIVNLINVRNNLVLKSDWYLTKDVLTNIQKQIKILRGYKVIILDFSQIGLTEIESFKNLIDTLVNLNQTIIYCGISKLLARYVALRDSEYRHNPDGQVVSDSKGMEYYNTHLNPLDEWRASFISKKVKNCLRKLCPEKESYLSSSNLYANRYINVKSFANFPSLYNLSVFQMFLLLKTNFRDAEYDKLISVSLTGSHLATVLGQMLGKPVLYFTNLGPNLRYRDIDVFKKVCEQKMEKYLFVGDMICTTNEIKIADAILRLKNAKITGGVTIVQYLDSPKLKKIYSIAKVDEDDPILNYSIYSKKRSDD